MSDLQAAAIEYAQRGWRVFRIKPGSKIPMDRWVHGPDTERAMADGQAAAHRWHEAPQANVGIATGNGLAVLDIDPQHGGKVPSWAPPTLTARTPSGGAHLYYDVGGFQVKNSAGQLGPGIDVRGDGGMVVAPPSQINPSAGGGAFIQEGPRYYEWVDPDHTIAQIDPRLLTSLQGGRRSGRTAQLIGTFGAGQRHDAMLNLAGRMRSWGCEYPEISAALHALNRSRFEPVLEDEWVEKVAKSIVQYAPDHELVRS